MKKLKEVEADRRAYHKDPTINTVHRSSLMVPEMSGTKANISFLNHFLLKRNHQNIGCKISAIDENGNLIESKLHKIDKPIVYTIPLTGMVDKPVSNYIIEFFSPDNLFIPFPAAMINHVGKNFINQVHSYNRILNDIFEDDTINKNQVREASVDLPLTENSDTFLLFTTGPIPCKDEFEIEVTTQNRNFVKSYPIDLPRFATKKISIEETFNDLPKGEGGIITARQPRQLLFYGRMLCGQMLRDNSFSANHSYYDSSTVEEYWDSNEPSQRTFPFFPKIFNIVRIYPIMSPSKLSFFIGLYDTGGSLFHEFNIGNLESPSNNFLDVNVNSLIKKENIDVKDVSTFTVKVKAESGKMPTRIGHQLVYGMGKLDSSISIALFHPDIFHPENKNSFKWGQMIIGNEYDSFIGIVADPCENPNIVSHECKVIFYSSKGKIAERNWTVKNGSAIKFELSKEVSELNNHKYNDPNFVWCTVESEKYGLNFFSVSYNKISNHFSGDHGF